MTEAKQVDTTEVELGGLHEARLLHQAGRQVVVDLHVAELQERAVALPISTRLIVVGIARSREAWELSIHIGVGRTPTAIVILLRERGGVQQRPVHTLGTEVGRVVGHTLEHQVDANTFVNIRVYFKKITVVVTGTNINEENFPDEHFRNWLLSQSYGKDAVITDTEMAGITKISARACGIEDLTGIELFTDLTELDLSNLAGTHPEESWNKISTIDLGSNTKLRKFYINNNQLSSIDISNNSNLRIIDVSNNLLTELDVSDNPNLESLTCNGNLLTGLDVTDNPNLEILSCSENQLSVLDISQNPLMNQLFCDNNCLT